MVIWSTVSPIMFIVLFVCALVGGLQVAVFRIAGEEIYAISNFDPFSGAFVLSRGIVGSRAERLKVASPIYKHVYDLRTGECYTDPQYKLDEWEKSPKRTPGEVPPVKPVAAATEAEIYRKLNLSYIEPELREGR